MFQMTGRHAVESVTPGNDWTICVSTWEWRCKTPWKALMSTTKAWNTGLKPKYDAMHGKGGKKIKYSKPIETYIKSKRSATRPKLLGWKEDDRISSAYNAKPGSNRFRPGFCIFGSDMNMVNEINVILRSRFRFRFRFLDSSRIQI